MSGFELPQLAPKERCTGCGACRSGCPKGAIHMLPGREGFLYPTVTDACVQCGHCTHVCPVLKQHERRSPPAAFLAWNLNESERMRSSAGGVFTLLAEYVLEQGGVVFGAGVDQQLRVRHMAARSRQELSPLLGAKPVESELDDTYPRVRHYLDQGRRVLFCGTPCQVDGLYRYLGEYPDNLLTADVACRGVSSPGVWEQLVRSMAYVKRAQPVDVCFCDKLGGEKEPRFRVTFDDGSVYDAPYGKSELGRGLRRALFLRPSCHTCPYTTTDRPGDLTLGTYRGDGVDPAEARRGVSLLLVNTAKGARTLDVLEVKKERLTVDEAVAACDALRAPVEAPAQRGDFFEAFARQPFQQVRNRFLAPMAYRGRSAAEMLEKIRNKEWKLPWKKH